MGLGWALGAGIVLPPGLTSCGVSDRPDQPGPTRPGETFVEPPALSSVARLLDVTLTVGYVRTVLNGKPVNLRSYNASIPGPTLRINAGDTLRIRLVNSLPANPPSTELAAHLRYPNSTNLHTHGLHVNPGILSPSLFGDYVVDDGTTAVQPGQSRQHEYRIGAGHPPGAYFYHPHLHGTTAIQMGSGMAGALIVGGGEINNVPEIALAAQRVFVFQSPVTDANGQCESFGLVGNVTNTETPFLINGARRPRIVLYRGEVQNWHFVNAGIFNYMNVALDGHALSLYSVDGNPRKTMLPIGPGVTVEGVVLAPGNRASVLVQAGKPGTYQLRNLAFQPADVANPNSLVAEDVIAEVVVLEDSMQMALPSGLPPPPAALAPITDTELAAAGGLKRTIAFRAVTSLVTNQNNANNKEPLTPAGLRNPDGSVLIAPGTEFNDWIYNTPIKPDGTLSSIANTVFATSSNGGTASANPGNLSPEFIPFQSRRALKQTIPINAVEEWTIYNMNSVRHPFHIHVNPVMVTRVNNVPVEPYWVDTIGLPNNGTPQAPSSVTFRIRVKDFKGLTVLHCHMLVHEDMGMMQLVEIV